MEEKETFLIVGEKEIFLIKLVFSESLMAVGLIPIFLNFLLPVWGWVPMPESYERAIDFIWAWCILAPIFFWAGGILLHKSLGEKMPVGSIIWYGFLFMIQVVWIMTLLYKMVIY